MVSKLLSKYGVQMFLAGAGYNFRTAHLSPAEIGQQVAKVRQAGGFKDQVIYTLQQVHSDRVVYADGVNGDPCLIGRQFSQADGLLTGQPGIILMTKFADCTPIVLFDPIHKVLGSLHSGWRGTAQEISKRAIDQMHDRFGSQPEDLLAYIGPSIDQDHYEVGQDVYQAFADQPSRNQFLKMGTRPGKYQLSMVQANLALLLEAGLRKDQIEIAKESTYTSKHLHSSRLMGSNYQLNALFVMMK